MKKVCVTVPGREQVGMQRLDGANLRHRIVNEYVEVDTGIVWAIVQNEVPRLVAQLQEQTAQAWTSDEAITRNLKELEYGG